MSTSVHPRPKIVAQAMRVWFDEHLLRVELRDGREIAVPLDWFPTLRDASPAQRGVWRLIGGGVGINWAELDEDVSVAGLLATRDGGTGGIMPLGLDRLEAGGESIYRSRRRSAPTLDHGGARQGRAR